MGLKRQAVIGTVLVLGCVFTIPLNPAWPHDPAQDLNQSVDKEKKQLEQLKKKLEVEREKRSAARNKEKSTLSQLENIDRRLTLKKKELSSVNRQLHKRTHAIQDLEQELQGLQKEVDSKRDRVRAGARVLYQESRFNTLRVLLASSDYYDFLKRYYYLSWVSEKESEILANYRETVVRLEKKEQALLDARAALLEDKRKVSGVVSAMRSDKRKKSGLLARVREDKTFHENAIRELEESASRVTALINRLEKKRESSIAGLGFPRQKGRMGWPTTGKVVAFFGRQKHPKFDTFINKKGIEIQSRQGAPIRAVYQGAVVYADWFRGYGLLIILDHGEGYYSLYAHAAKLAVSVGDRVKNQQVIGEIGDTGLTGAANLYFEIRHGGEPINPLAWLEKK
jgi:murein hydrolase activator